MKALVIAPQPFFSPRATSLCVYNRVLMASRLGVQLDLLTYGEGDNVDIPGVRIIRIPRFKAPGLVRVGSFAHKLFLDVLLLFWTVGLLLRKQYDFVHAHKDAVFWCRFLKPVFRFKLVYDMHSSLPQQLVNSRITTSKLLIGLCQRIERTCLRHSDAVITICPDLRDYARHEGVADSRNFMIENSICETEYINNLEEQRVTCRPTTSGTGDCSTVVYIGTFGPCQGIDLLVRAFTHVVDLKPNTQLFLAGGTQQQVQRIRQLADGFGLNGRCVLTGRVNKQQVKAYMRSADVLVLPRTEGVNSPLNIYKQLVSGKPLVATRIWSHVQVLDDDVCFLTDPDPESLASSILAALEDEQRRKRVVSQAKLLYRTRYPRAAYQEKMRQMLKVLR